MGSLSTQLFEEVRSDFFRILGYESAPLYLDAVDAIASAMPARGGGIARADALEIIGDILRMNPGASVEGQTPENSTIPAKSNLVLNKLTGSGWVEEPERSDYQRHIFLDPNAEILLDALRRIAQPDPAQFTGLLRTACNDLADEGAAGTFSWEDLRACLTNLDSGVRELKAMSKSVERLTRKQLGAATLERSVAIVYGDFSSEIGNKCYRELVRAQLPEKLVQARRGLSRLMADESVLARLLKGLMHHRRDIAAGDAMAEVVRTTESVETALHSIEPLSERVDARAAEFTRRSRARIHYLSTVGSSRARQVQEVFRIVGERFNGMRLTLADDDFGMPGLRLGEPGIITGESLRRPPSERTLTDVDAIEDDISEAERERCVEQMASNIAFSVTVDRAHRFLDEIGCLPNHTISSADLPLKGTSDEIEDVVSLLLYANTDSARYEVNVPHRDVAEAERESDQKGGYIIERFEVTRHE
jgi:hypothetical protein